jgi:hypothetical protein
MADVALLDFSARFVRLHSEGEADKPVEVFPAVHDAIEMDHDALNAIAERYGGRYIRCDDLAPEDHQATAPINQPMAQYLMQLCASRNMPIKFVENDGRVVAFAEDYGEPTGSLPMVLRILAFLASTALECPLVVLSYSLIGLDEVRAALVWEATLAAGLFSPQQLRTFVPVAGGDVDVAAHCNRQEGSARLVVRDGEFIERAPSRALADSLRMVLPDVNSPVVLFLGAGSSASSTIPQGNRFRDLALASLTDREIGSTELVPAFRQWLNDRGRWMEDEQQLPLDMFERSLTLERVLREEFYALSGRDRSESVTLQRMRRDCTRALDRQPPGRQAIWQLAGLLPRLIIVTVNFDQQIEVGMTADHVLLVSREQFAEHRDLVVARLNGDPTPVPILKLHGTIDDFSSLVADFTTTSRGLSSEKTQVLDSIVSTAGYLPWVWVGCSMRDADVASWLAGKSGRTDLLEWWVDPLPPRSVRAYAMKWRAKDWAQIDQTLKDRQITEVSDRFLHALAEYVKVKLAEPSV